MEPGSGEDGPHVLQIYNSLRSPPAQELNSILVSKIIRALHGIEGMAFPVIMGCPLCISKGSIDPSLGCNGM